MLEKQRKLSAFLIASILLLGGLFAPCDAAKYNAFSLAISGLASVLIGAHVVQRGKELAGGKELVAPHGDSP